MRGRIHQISVSGGGVPKLAVPRAEVRRNGIVGDEQNNNVSHGGPERAVCLFSLEVIERLRAEGHPIVPGAAGENLTLSGLDWPRLAPGTRLRFDGGVELEVTSFTGPCKKISAAFAGGEFIRIRQEMHPGDSRVCARVIAEGELTTGEGLCLEAAAQANKS